MLPTRRKLSTHDLTETTQQGAGQADELFARSMRARIASGVQLHDARSSERFDDGRIDGDDEPSESDIQQQRAYADWLASFEPGQHRTRERKDRVGLG
jgi:hypothetical protein